MFNASHAGRRMDKRIAGIIRWLERCRSSYKSGAIESALMDAECARADLEDLRLDVWERVGDRYVPKRSRWGTMLCAFLLLPILMVMATPSRISPRVPDFAFFDFKPELEPKLETDAVTVTVPSANVNVKAKAQAKTTSAVSKKSQTKNSNANASSARQSRLDSKPEQEQKNKPAKQEIPTYDTMLALFQTGQRALKGN